MLETATEEKTPPPPYYDLLADTTPSSALLAVAAVPAIGCRDALVGDDSSGAARET
jgi:hypothetical protein